MRKLHNAFMKCVLLMLTVALIVPYLVLDASPQVSGTTVVQAQPSKSAPLVGETLTVNITVSNVENLYSVDVALRWNASILKFLDAQLRLGVESNPGGVLHEEVYIIENAATQAEYALVATSIGTAPSFNGSGTIASVTFSVTGIGQAGLQVESELADHPLPGENANLIAHSDVTGSVGSVPEFSSIVAAALFLTLATGVIIYARKHLKKNAFNRLPT